MKKNIIIMVISIFLFACKQQDKDISIKKDLSEILEAIKTDNGNKLYSYLLSREVIDELLINADKNRKEAVKAYSEHLQKKPNDFLIELKDNKLDGWETAKPCMLMISDGYGGYGGMFFKKVEFIIEFKSKFGSDHYQLEFYIYNHKGKNYYIIKDNLDKINTKGQCSEIYNETEQKIIKFKEKEPKRYEIMKPKLIKY
jgi:hypothetical protein